MPRNIGIMGAGNIAARYVSGIRRRFPQLDVVRVSDIDVDRAARLAAEFGIGSHGGNDEMLRDESVEIVVNLTPPQLHAPSVIQTLMAGKHVYVEKPLAVDRTQAMEMIATAQANGVLLGSAPDTFMGSAQQTTRHAIDSGLVGTVIGATGFVRSSRVETWHPDPRFLFKPGGGPVMDMGPYYMAALVNALGPITRVTGDARIGNERLSMTAPERLVDTIEVSVNTHASAVLSFASGAIGTVMMSFDVWDTELPYIEIYGTEGTLTLPDPNNFDGPVRIRTHGDADWRILEPVIAPFGALDLEQYERGLGVADLATAIDGGAHRATGEFALHVLDALLALDQSAQSQQSIHLASTTARPTPLYDAEPLPSALSH